MSDIRCMICILTGDIADSRKLKNQGEWLEPLKKLFSDTIGVNPQMWEIYRGDSFQLEVTNPEDALLIALRIKAVVKSVRKIDVRMAMGIGRKDYQGERITESNGEAFINSGDKFEQLKKDGHLLGIKTPWAGFDREMNLIFRLALIAMDSWTVGAAEVMKVSLQLPNLNQQEISKMLGLSQPSISERQKRAHITEIMDMEAWYREKIRPLMQSVSK